MRLAGKTALITGGNSGIGLATTRLFRAEGARVGITGRNKTTLDAAVEALGTGIMAIQADVTDVVATEQAIATIASTFGRLDILFANAASVYVHLSDKPRSLSSRRSYESTLLQRSLPCRLRLLTLMTELQSS
jgi:NAD(P)-dependent dehydrogenase (short-subunit alcohol dehydrogenase family)